MTATIALALVTLSASGLIAFVRLLRGPGLPDRVVAIDLIGVVCVEIAVVSAAESGQDAFLDVAIVIALISFVGTVAYARYIEREGRT
jgi:multicomponent Na+:H+ antiporter subunit F